MSGNVFPILAAHDAADIAGRAIVLNCEISERDIAGGISASYLADLICCQPLHMEAMLDRSIAHVVELRSQKQVIGIDAQGNVALVQDIQHVRYGANEHHVREAMRAIHTFSNTKLSVALPAVLQRALATGSPQPTSTITRFLVYFGEKSLVGCGVMEQFVECLRKLRSPRTMGRGAHSTQRFLRLCTARIAADFAYAGGGLTHWTGFAAALRMTLHASLIAARNALSAITACVDGGYTRHVTDSSSVAAPGTFTASPGTFVCSPNYTAITGRFGEC